MIGGIRGGHTRSDGDCCRRIIYSAVMKPIHGHALLHEGHTHRRWKGEEMIVEVGCECGARPDDWQHMTVNATKRWHMLHKSDILGDPNQRPDRTVHVRSKTWVFCDVHGAPHVRMTDPHDFGSPVCDPSDWRTIWVAGSFEEQDRF